MSRSVLYQCFGIHGYHHLKIWRSGGATFLKIVGSKKRCSVCRSWDVIQKGYRWRTLRVLPVGRKPVFAMVKMRRFHFTDPSGNEYAVWSDVNA